MSQGAHRLAFGPVPSRRLGNSLGINNIPPKACTYGCAYCQVGPTTERAIEPRAFFQPEEIVEAVTRHVEAVRSRGADIDYATFVPDGEPTLDVNIGQTIAALRRLEIPVAVITNGSLLQREEVRARLAEADLVSVKVDAVDERPWKRVNAPSRELRLPLVLEGVRAFARGFRGRLLTDTMLVSGINDGEEQVGATAAFVAELEPAVAYIAVPTRPPSIATIEGADESSLTRAYEAFSALLPRVELLTGHEGDGFAHTGDARTDLLSITAVHPMREGAVRKLIDEDGASWSVVEALTASGELSVVLHDGERFYLRSPLR